MNLEYLINEIMPQRKKEILEGKNLCTSNPIYLVYDLIETACSGHSDFSLDCNLKGKGCEYGFIDSAENDDFTFYESDDDLIEPKPVTRFWVDKLAAIFLTSEAAHEYLERQKHNLSDDAYVYVDSVGYANFQMKNLLNDE